MKNKISVLTLSKVIFIFLFFCSLLSCSHGDEIGNINKFEKYDVIVIDSCEYIQYGDAYGYLSITHKGNCKYCAERAKHLLK